MNFTPYMDFNRVYDPQEEERRRRQQAYQPVDPFNYIVQLESGGKDFDQQGRPLTSPAGAKYSAQVMPATAQGSLVDQK